MILRAIAILVCGIALAGAPGRPAAAQAWSDVLERFGGGAPGAWSLAPGAPGQTPSRLGWGGAPGQEGSRYPWRAWRSGGGQGWDGGAPWDWSADNALPGAGMTLTRDSRRLMRAHGQNVVVLGLMFAGYQPFERATATRLAREIQRASGEDMWRRYMPGNPRDGEANRSLIWQYFLIFRKYAEALRLQSARLADNLARPLRPEDVQAGNFWVPPRLYDETRGGIGSWDSGGGAITRDAAAAFHALVVVCQDCHTQFRIE